MLLSPLIALLPPPGSTAFTVIVACILFEIGFFFHFHLILIPNANSRINTSLPPAPYRDYSSVQDRIKLLQRILARIGKKAGMIPLSNDNTTSSKAEIYYKFIASWFICTQDSNAQYEQFSRQFDMATLDVGLCPPPPPMLRMAWKTSSLDRSEGLNGSSSESSLNEDGNAVCCGNSSEQVKGMLNASSRSFGHEKKSKLVGRLQKDNMDEFLSWAFFGVHYSTVQSSPEMMSALSSFYRVLKSEADLTFEPGRNANFTPRCFTFEEVNSLYRPYGVYAGVALMRLMANIILFMVGFRLYTCERGLRYWHRPSKKSGDAKNQTSFLFFHGIAPGGHAPYLPMIFFGLLWGSASQRDIFFFENKPVSYSMCFDAVTEEDTVHGVLEAVNKHLGTVPDRNLTLCGHSLGSCQLTYAIKSPELCKRIQNIILIDPVSILLSEPDVMINFLYTRRENEDAEDASNNWIRRLVRFFNESKIHLVASSELFIEHYLRRNFSWYNSELWLNDIPSECNVLVCLSEHDEIVNSSKVEREISEHNNALSEQPADQIGPKIKLIMWKAVGHAHCITHSDKWTDMRNAMLKMKQ